MSHISKSSKQLEKVKRKAHPSDRTMYPHDRLYELSLKAYNVLCDIQYVEQAHDISNGYRLNHRGDAVAVSSTDEEQKRASSVSYAVTAITRVVIESEMRLKYIDVKIYLATAYTAFDMLRHAIPDHQDLQAIITEYMSEYPRMSAAVALLL